MLEFLVALSKLFANLAVRLLLGQAEYSLLVLFISRIRFIKISLKILVFFTALDQLITHLANFRKITIIHKTLHQVLIDVPP